MRRVSGLKIIHSPFRKTNRPHSSSFNTQHYTPHYISHTVPIESNRTERVIKIRRVRLLTDPFEKRSPSPSVNRLYSALLAVTTPQ